MLARPSIEQSLVEPGTDHACGDGVEYCLRAWLEKCFIIWDYLIVIIHRIELLGIKASGQEVDCVRVLRHTAIKAGKYNVNRIDLLTHKHIVCGVENCPEGWPSWAILPPTVACTV